MTTKTISTYIAAGYTLSASYSQLVITAKGGVGGTGVIAHAHATVTNSGKVNGDVTTGIDLTAGGNVINEVGGLVTGPTAIENTTGRVTNYGKIEATGAHYAIVFSAGGTVINGSYAATSALISGEGVEIVGGLGTVTNLATIKGTAYLFAGGKVTNGAAGDTTALIAAGDGVVIANAAGTVSNYASIQGYATSGSSGVYLRDGGGVANGSAVDTSARIEGGTGVEIRYAASVANFGAIVGTSASYGAGGVALHNGGAVTNGSATDRGASIQGYFGVLIESTAGTVINFGVITGEGAPNGVAGVSLAAGGRVTNGTGDDTGALIQGASGVELGAAGTVVNSGTVDGASSEGVLLEHGGLVTNGGAGDRSALISGYRGGVLAFGATATVKNFGAVLGTGGSAFQPRAVRLLYGGVLINGSPNNSTALVAGYTGAALYVTGASTNFGTILGTGDLGGSGATLGGGVSLQNGASGHATALVEGYAGVTATGTANTLTNFGVIAGAAGYAVDFDSPTDVLVVEAGSAFSGAINGGGGTLALGDGAWTHAGLLTSAGNITLSGPIAATTFGGFGALEVASGASLAVTGAGTVFAGQGLIVSGLLTAGGAITNAGSLVVGGGTLAVSGAVSGAGIVKIAGGTADFGSTFTENVTFTGATGVLELARATAYTGSITGFSKTGTTSLDLLNIGFTSGTTKATYSGTTASGVLTVTDGTHTAKIHLIGDYTASTFTVASDGHGGTSVVDPTAAPVGRTPPMLPLVSAMAGFASPAAAPAAHAIETWRRDSPALAGPAVRQA